MSEAPFNARCWTGLFQWPGKKVFRVGTVALPLRVPLSEVDLELKRLFEELWGGILPDHFERPELVRYEPGMVVFIPEDEHEA